MHERGWTVLELEIELGETQATAQKRTLAIQLQGRDQERFDHKFVDQDPGGSVYITSFDQLTYFICQNTDTAYNQQIQADTGTTDILLKPGELVILPRITAYSGNYILLVSGSGDPECRYAIIGRSVNG